MSLYRRKRSMKMLPQSRGAAPLGETAPGAGVARLSGSNYLRLCGSGWERDLCGNTAPVALKNPIASQMSVMRSSLLGGLLAALRSNLARKEPRVRLFEMVPVLPPRRAVMHSTNA